MPNREGSRFIRCFADAFRGVRVSVRQERNVRFHLCAAVYVLAYAACVRLPAVRLAVALGLIGAVLSMELINSAIERLCDQLGDGYRAGIRQVKDLAAGAVLVAAVLSAASGVALMGEYVPEFFRALWRRPLAALLWLLSLPAALAFIFYRRRKL